MILQIYIEMSQKRRYDGLLQRCVREVSPVARATLSVTTRCCDSIENVQYLHAGQAVYSHSTLVPVDFTSWSMKGA